MTITPFPPAGGDLRPDLFSSSEENSLVRFSKSSLNSAPSFTSQQIQVDGLVSNFLGEAFQLQTLASISAGQFSSRWIRLGLREAPRSAAIALSLGGEAAAFETSGRILQSISDDPLNLNLWRWDGVGGGKQGLLSSLINFSFLHGGASVARRSHFVFQHSVTSTAMVAGHQLAAAWGLSPAPEGSFPEQFFQAEVMNIQLHAGMGLVYSAAPRIVTAVGV